MFTLETYQLKEIKTYCQSNCKSIINEQNKKDIEKSRGQYKGFTYGIKTINYLLSQVNLRTKKTELYRHFKEQHQVVLFSKYKDNDFNEGVKESLYKIMNYVSALEKK